VRRTSYLLTVLLLAATACGGHFPQTTLQPKADFGFAIQGLFGDIFWWAVVVFTVVETLLVVTLIRFRARPGGPTPKPLHGHTVLEIAWTLAPALILVFIAVPTVRTIFSTEAPAPAGALKVSVIGHQWWWEYRYPDLGITTANELHLPVGQPVDLTLTTADVIHSFWDPAMGGKRDLIPTHENHLVFRPESTGTFLGQCAEFCGASHANMRLRVMVQGDSAWKAWVADQQALPAPVKKGSLEEQGAQAFQRYGCTGCHTMGDMAHGIVGPNLTHVASRTTIVGGTVVNDSAGLARWIGDPPGTKPGSLMPNMHVPPADIAALVAFLRSMK